MNKKKTSGVNRLLLVLAVVCLVLGAAALAGQRYSGGKTESIGTTGAATGVQNNSIVYDAALDILAVGTQGNEIVAFRDGQELWRAQGDSAFMALAVDSSTGTLLGASGNHIYRYHLQEGTQLADIDVQRRIVAIDVSKDGSKIAAVTSTGASKANALLYTADGEQLLNNSYQIKINGVCFTSDGENIIIGNNRGELIRLAMDGTEEGKYETGYTVLQIVRYGENHLALCKDGSFYGFDDDLNVIRQGKATNEAQAVFKSIGADASGENVAIGTEEGFLYVLNKNNEQIYTTDIDSMVNGFAQNGEEVYIAGAKPEIQTLHVANLANIGVFTLLAQVLIYVSAAALLAGLVLLLLAFPGTGARLRKLAKEIWRHKIAYILLLPTFLLVWFFNYRGILTAFTRAFTNWSVTNNTLAKIDFTGLDNFRRMVTEGYFLIGMKNLVLLMATGILKTLTMPLLAAWLVYALRGNRKKYVSRFLFVLPVVVPGVVTALTWQKIYDPNIGLLNEVLGVLGMTGLQRVWLGDASTALWAVIFMGFPFISAMAFLVYYGGFIGIGRELEESARVDGANRSKIFWKIQLPLIRPQIAIMITLTLIGTVQDFNNIYILTGGGPGTSTYVPALELYFNVAQFGRYGYACALGVVMFIFIMLVTMLNMRLTRERD